MSIHSGDIREQSRKLSEIAPNFGRFFALPNFRGTDLPKFIPNLYQTVFVELKLLSGS